MAACDTSCYRSCQVSVVDKALSLSQLWLEHSIYIWLNRCGLYSIKPHTKLRYEIDALKEEHGTSWTNEVYTQVCNGGSCSSLYVWWTSWSISSRGMLVSGPWSLDALLSKAATICFTTSSKNSVASFECSSERNSNETEKSNVHVLG